MRTVGARIAAAVACAIIAAGATGCSQADAEERGTAYDFESVVRCGAERDCQRFQRGGWGAAEHSFTWTTRTSAKLKFSLPPVKGPLGLRLRLQGNLAPPELPCQVVEVYANNEKVALWLVDAAEDFTAIIPGHVVGADGKLCVELKIPRAQRLGHSPPDEARRFGVACYEMEVSRAASVPTTLAPTVAMELPRD
jgi:hypothetical protein